MLVGGVAQRIGVVPADAVALETQENAGDFEKPRILHRVVDAIQVAEHGGDAFARRRVGAQRFLVHAGGMGQFGVIVVAENVVETAGRRLVRINVGMWVDQRDLDNLVKQVARELIVIDHGDDLSNCAGLTSGMADFTIVSQCFSSSRRRSSFFVWHASWASNC